MPALTMTEGVLHLNDLEKLLASVDDAREELVEFHQALVRFPTINTGQMPTGNETECCEYIRQRLETEGIDSQILESAPGRGNLVARMKGEGTGPSLLFMSHLDVVPIEDESKWSHPPFSGEIIDGAVWGRGSDDCKSVTAAAYGATVLLKRSGLLRKGDVVLTATADEEAGGNYGYKWLAKNAPDEIRADYSLNEGGGMPLRAREGYACNLAVGEKGRVEVTITIEGRSGHAARPWEADNALGKAARVIAAVSDYQPEIDVSHPIFDWLDTMVEGIDRPTVDTLEDVLQKMASVDRSTASLLRALSRMTLTPTVLQAGQKSNSIPASAVLTCDSRTLPGQDADYVKRQVEQTLKGIDGITVETETWAQSTQSPFDTPFTQMLEKTLAVAIGRSDVTLIPSLTMGFTDSQWVRPLGVQAYGFAPINEGGSAARPGIHGINENFEIEALIARTRAFLAAAYFTVVTGLESDPA